MASRSDLSGSWTRLRWKSPNNLELQPSKKRKEAIVTRFISFFYWSALLMHGQPFRSVRLLDQATLEISKQFGTSAVQKTERGHSDAIYQLFLLVCPAYAWPDVPICQAPGPGYAGNLQTIWNFSRPKNGKRP